MTPPEVIVIGVCTFCGEKQTRADYDKWSSDGQKEWHISQVCEPCFDYEFDEDRMEQLYSTNAPESEEDKPF